MNTRDSAYLTSIDNQLTLVIIGYRRFNKHYPINTNSRHERVDRLVNDPNNVNFITLDKSGVITIYFNSYFQFDRR